VVQEFEGFRHSSGFIAVPWRLWVPDEEEVNFAWVGRLHNLLLGRASRRLRVGGVKLGSLLLRAVRCRAVCLLRILKR